MRNALTQPPEELEEFLEEMHRLGEQIFYDHPAQH
jgi:predicted metal-dependent phosphoesterase TrpH